jgi:ParB family transcriptional regulator, chromosome partitioning protein
MNATSQCIQLPIKDIGTGYSRLRIIHPKAETAMEHSIRKHGQITPVIVGRPDGNRFEMVDGFKRLRACLKLGHEHVSGKVLEGRDRALKASILYLNMKVSSIDDLEQALVIQSFYRQDGLDHAKSHKK